MLNYVDSKLKLGAGAASKVRRYRPDRLNNAGQRLSNKLQPDPQLLHGILGFVLGGNVDHFLSETSDQSFPSARLLLLLRIAYLPWFTTNC